MDVSALRTEIKSWERNFRATHGRDPSVQDIKEKPDLAQKYRQYKKLTKATEPAPSIRPSNPPSTPSRSQSRDSAQPSLLLSRPRAIAAAQPLSGYNPFSPQKNKGKQKELSPDAHPKSNPFRITRDPSPDPVPRLSFTSTSATTSSDPFAPTLNNAVSRARKRLRGEPVSPSPNKEKRRRMVSPHEGSEDEDEELSAANTSFVDDSPVKPPSGVRSFKLLFDETAAKPTFPLLRSKTLFGEGALEGNEKMVLDDLPPKSAETPTTIGQATAMDDPFFEPAGRENASSSDDEPTDDPAQKPPVSIRSLLAPSPPPANQRSSGKSHHNVKSRGKPISDGQKRGNMAESDDEDGNGRSDEDVEMNGNGSRHKVRLFDRTASRGRAREEGGIDEDTYHLMPRRPPDTDTSQRQSSESISIPDTLLSILSLAPTSSHANQDEHVVEELLYGTRRRNYDPLKGGEIWGVGEFEEEERDEFALNDGLRASTREAYDDEDDWEGEGVPWEVGEL